MSMTKIGFDGSFTKLERKNTVLPKSSSTSSLFEDLPEARIQSSSQGQLSKQRLQRRPLRLSSFAGEWKGIVSQTVYGFNPPKYSYSLSLERRGGTSFVGTSFVRDFINSDLAPFSISPIR